MGVNGTPGGWIMAKAEHAIHHNIFPSSPIKIMKPPTKKTFECAQPRKVYVLAVWVRGGASENV
jgi:hypothetical protein